MLRLTKAVVSKPRVPPPMKTWSMMLTASFITGANMPGSVPLTSSHALNNATLPFTLALADKGLKALDENPHLMEGFKDGKIVHPAVIEALGENPNLNKKE